MLTIQQPLPTTHHTSIFTRKRKTMMIAISTKLLLLVANLSLSIAQGGLKKVLTQPDKKLSWLSTRETTLDDLLTEYPSVSPSTVQRFYDIYGGRESYQLIPTYVEWKNGHQLLAVTDDTERWSLAVQQAYRYLTAPANVRKNKAKPVALPKQQVIYDLKRTDHKGFHVFSVLPMRMDLDLDDATNLYADILAGYLESFLADKPETTQVTLMADLRSGRGWPNPPLSKTVPAVEEIAKRLIHLHPEQLHRAIIYPVPTMSEPLYSMAKPFLGHELTDMITIIESNEGTGRHSPPPKAALLDYVDDATVEAAEANRLDLFRPRDKPPTTADAPVSPGTDPGVAVGQVGNEVNGTDATVVKLGDRTV